MVEKTQQNLDNYAKQGLRVLVMAKRVLPEEEYMEWLAKHRDAEVCWPVRVEGVFKNGVTF